MIREKSGSSGDALKIASIFADTYLEAGGQGVYRAGIGLGVKTLLIIEDDRAVAATYRHIFREAGFLVEVAPDGIEGVKLVSSLRPDAVVLDLLMPRLDGIEVLKFIRAHPQLSDTPVVVFSNCYMTNLIDSAWRAGADECLMKASTTPNQLFHAVKQIVSRPHRHGAPGARPAQQPLPDPPISNSSLGFAIPSDVLTRNSAELPRPVAQTNFDLERPVAPVLGPPLPAVSSPSGTEEHLPTAESRRAATATSWFIPSTGRSIKADTEFHKQILELFLKSSPDRLAKIRACAAGLAHAGDETSRGEKLEALFTKIHGLAGNAGLAGCIAIAQFTTTFEALLKELREQPKWINASTLNTIARSVHTLERMLGNAEQIEAPELPALSALVIEADARSSRVAAAALEVAGVRTTVTENLDGIINVLASSDHDVLVLGIDLQTGTAFDLLAQMDASPRHVQTPVIFVASQDNFASHQMDALVARHDIIAKPFLPMELALKALACAQRERLQP